MRHASAAGAVVLEDNVRFVQASAHREARELQAALQVLLKQSEETMECANNTDAMISASLEATAAVVGIWYWGYMGRADDLITAHSSSKNSVTGIGTCTTALVPFPPGNVPLWGCYAYAPLPAGWNALRSYLMARGPSALFEEKRRKKASNDSGPNGSSNTKSSERRGASSGRRVALPIDRLLPRRVRAAGLGLWRAEKPLAFRMPPPHPAQTAVSVLIPSSSLPPQVAVEVAPKKTTAAAAAETSAVQPADDSAPMASAIHPHLDLRFYAATTLQLQLTGRCQEAETGHDNLINAAAENTSTYTTVAGWSCLWLLPGEKASVALFQQDQHRRVATVPGAHWLLRPRNTMGSSSDDVSNSSAPLSGSHERNGFDQGDDSDISKWRGGDSTVVLSASSARAAIAQATTSHCTRGSEIEKPVNAVLAAVFVVGDRLGKLFPDAPANQVALMDAARWLSAYCRDFTTIAQCDSASRTNRNGSSSSSIEPVLITGSVKATAERGLCFVLRLLARAGAYADADEVLSLLLSSSMSTPITSSSVECNTVSTNTSGSCSENAAGDVVDSSDNVNSTEVNVCSSAIAIQLLSTPQQSPAWRHAAEALGMAINDSANKKPGVRGALVSPSPVVLTDPVVGPFLRQLATDLAEIDSVENPTPSSPNEDVVVVETESEDAEEVGKMKNVDTASVKQHFAWRTVSRCDLDSVLLKLLEERIDAQGGDNSKNSSNKGSSSDNISNVSKLRAPFTVRGALHDWFLGLSALAAHGPTVLLTAQKAEVSLSPPLQSFSARTLSSLVPCCPHVGPDLKTLCATVAFLCDQGLACDAHWLLATLGPSLVGPTHQLPTLNLVLPSPQINGSLEEGADLQVSDTKTATARSRSPLVQALSCTGDPAEVLRSLLVGACACGDASAAAWALRDGGIWTKVKTSTDEQEGGLMAYGPLPLRVARAVMKHIGRCCGTSDSTGDDSNNCDDDLNDDGNESGENRVDNSSNDNDNSIALLSIACEILDAVALTLPPKQAYSKAQMESTTPPIPPASTHYVNPSAVLAAERLATVLFDSAVASGALNAAAIATRWRRMLLRAVATATPKAAPAVTVSAGLTGGDMNVDGKTAATSPGKDATAATATAGVHWGSPEWSTKVDEAMGLLAACVGAHEHWVDADQAVCSLLNGTRQGKSGEIASLPWIREPVSSNASGVDEHNEDVTISTDHSGSEVELPRLNPLRWLFTSWPPHTATPGVLEPPHNVETCSMAAAGCLQWLPLPLARLLVRDCYAKPQSWRRGSGGGVKLIGKRAAWMRRVVCFSSTSSLELPDPARYDHHSLSRNDPATRDRELGTANLLLSLEGSESGLNMPWFSSFASGLRWVNAFAEVRGASDARVLEEDITHGLCCRIAHMIKTIRESSRYQGCGNHVDSSSLSSNSVTVIEHREGAVAALELILGALSSAVALDLCSVKSGDKLLALALRALEIAVSQVASPSPTTTSTTEGGGFGEGKGNPYNVGAETRAALEERAARFLMASLALYSTNDDEASSVDVAHDWDGDDQEKSALTSSDPDSGSPMSLHPSVSTLSFGFGAPLPLLLLATLARNFHLFESKATSSEAIAPPTFQPSSDATIPPAAPPSSLNSTRCEKLRAAYATALASSLHRAATESLNESFSRAVSKAAAKDKVATAGQVFNGATEPSNTQAFAWRVDLPVLGLGAAEPLFSAHGAWLRDAVGCEPCFAAGFALLVAAAPPHSPQALKKCSVSGGNASSSSATSWKEALRAWVQSPQPLKTLAAAVSRAVPNANTKEGTSAVTVAVMKLQQSVKTALGNLSKEL